MKVQTLGDAEAEAPSIEANHSADDVATTAPEILEEKQAPVEVDAVDVPEDWAELPAEKAAAFGAEIDAACVGTEIGFRMANPMNDVRVLWNFGDGQFSSETRPSARVQRAGHLRHYAEHHPNQRRFDPDQDH